MVCHLKGSTGLPGDGQGFLECFHHALSLVPHVGFVKRTVREQLPAQSRQLFGVGVAAGGIDQSAGKTERTVPQGLPQQSAHGIQLRGNGLAGLKAHDGQPDGTVSHSGSEVDAGASCFQKIQIAADAFPGVIQIAHIVPQLLFLRRIRTDRRHGESAVSTDLRGDALEDAARRQGVFREGGVAVGVDVDEAGGETAVVSVHQFPCCLRWRRCRIHPHDGPVLDRHPSPIPRGGGAVDDADIFDDQVVHGLIFFLLK